jgi:hypothetical protein
MNTQGGMEVKLQPFLTAALDAYERLAEGSGRDPLESNK